MLHLSVLLFLMPWCPLVVIRMCYQLQFMGSYNLFQYLKVLSENNENIVHKTADSQGLHDTIIKHKK